MSTPSSSPAASPYGDYLRCGAIAKFSPVMEAVRKFAADGGLVLGICNGFQILVEAGLLPGALMRNRDLKFICREVRLRTETTDSPFTAARKPARSCACRSPTAKAAMSPTSARSTSSKPKIASPSAMSITRTARMRDIAGILNAGRNVMGMMPHPERATEPLMGSSDGLVIFRSLVAAVQPAAAMSTIAITPDLIAQHQLTESEYQKIVAILGREPNYTELGIFSVMWSEHCSYKSSRLHLKKLPTRGKLVVQGPGENAGIIDIGGGYVIAFKIESHNHPSFIEPFQGAATGVGGILRDIFTMGARPIAVLDSLRFGPLDDPQAGARNRRILQGVVAGIAHYGNCFGVPTVGGECIFEACYNGNPLVNVFALGVAKKDDIFYARAAGIGNPVIYVGAKTGRDGIHGASMASRRVHRGIQAEAAQRAGGRSVPRKAAARSLPRSHADRRHRRHSGHGRGRPHLLHLRDGQPRRHRHRDRTGPRAAARNRHDALRDHALRIAGAHAAGGREGPRRRGLPGVPQVGTGRRHHRRQSPAMACCA